MCKITAMRKTIAQLFATSLDCEQALLFWQAKRAAIERARELAGKLVTPPNGMTGKIKRSENNEKKNIKETPVYAAPSDRGNNWRNEIV